MFRHLLMTIIVHFYLRYQECFQMFKLQYIMQLVDCEIIFLSVRKTVVEQGAFPLF